MLSSILIMYIERFSKNPSRQFGKFCKRRVSRYSYSVKQQHGWTLKDVSKFLSSIIIVERRGTNRNGWRENGRRNKGGSGGEGARFFNWALLRKRRRAKERRRKERGGVGDGARKKEERGGSHRALLLIPRNGSINEMAGQTKPNAIARNTRSSWAPAPCVSLERSTASLAVPAPSETEKVS